MKEYLNCNSNPLKTNKTNTLNLFYWAYILYSDQLQENLWKEGMIETDVGMKRFRHAILVCLYMEDWTFFCTSECFVTDFQIQFKVKWDTLSYISVFHKSVLLYTSKSYIISDFIDNLVCFQ